MAEAIQTSAQEMTPYRVGILGATGMVGQRFVTLLSEHPWFEIAVVAASPSSAGKLYTDAVQDRWHMSSPIPDGVASLTVRSVVDDLASIAAEVDIVFCALDMDKDTIRQVETDYAAAGVAVISNNSAHRWTEDVPMLMPEVNLAHTALIDVQRRQRGWSTGFIAVKPNCSIQSYVSVLTALVPFVPRDVSQEKCGYDIESKDKDGELRFIEVKGRIVGAPTVTVTKNEIIRGLNSPERFILAVVEVDEDRASTPRYIRNPFSKEPEFETTSVNFDLSKILNKATEPS